MPNVYEFTEFPRRIGFIAKDESEVPEAVNEVLVGWGEGLVTVYNLKAAYFDTGKIRLVKEFPDTDEGWDKAFELAHNLEEY